MLENPIPALYNGRAVRIYGTILDGRCLIAYDDGATGFAPWDHLRLTIGEAEDAEPVEHAPPEPWGEWTMHRDPNWGETWTRRRNHGTDRQYVRREQAGWCWRWVTGVSSGDGFQSADEARAACEGFTVQTEGVPAAPTEDEATRWRHGEPTGEWSEWRENTLSRDLWRFNRTTGDSQVVGYHPGLFQTYWKWTSKGHVIAEEWSDDWRTEDAIADCEAKTAGATSPPTKDKTAPVGEWSSWEPIRLQQLANPIGLVRRHTDQRRQFISCLRPGKWRWHEARDGVILRDEQPFASVEAAIADCEAKTAGATSPPTKDKTAPVGEWLEWQQISPWGHLLRKHTTRDHCQRINPTDGGWYWREAINGREGARHGPFPSWQEAIADCDTITGASTLDTDTTTNSLAGLDAAGGAE